MAKDNLDRDLFVPAKQDDEGSEKIQRPSLSYWQDAWIRLRKNKGAIFGMIVLFIIFIMAIIGPFFNEKGINDQDLGLSKLPPRVQGLEDVRWLGMDGTKSDTFEASSVEAAKERLRQRYTQRDDEFMTYDVKSDKEGNAKVKGYFHIYEAKGLQDQYYWFGTDTLGRDLFTRTWYGTRISLYIAFLAAAIDMIIGVAYGGISAYYGGRVDDVMQRIIEILVGIPNLVVVILMIMILDPGIISITIALTITGWIGMARIVRGQVLKLKNQEFVLASRTLGSSNTRILSKHLIPNTLGMIIVNTMFTIPSAIFFEAFLSFIGLGLQSPQASLGTLINDGFKALQINPYIMIFPAIVISLIMVAFNILADGLRDALDPKMRE
ncbi:peptide ABC transporter permease [Thalassobacillus devorans]|uniref:Peptide ABC transporter permease n=1 Tax=Thalassobacillus devorans TaxID=279813 RepID=A0ABQ1NHB7_9BACI|nr:oligopeptide ABC transporter permease [Thalassobacillus devorans]NIK27068.1 oligopeptide transport system permease protein [Thalassobacillus devorans]GGC74654.1 peptide ABC transporter permease [Thalassobacillus devorans]